MKLPSGRIVYSSTPVYTNSNFTWGEVTKDCHRLVQHLIINNRLIVRGEAVEQNIITTAKNLDKVRGILGDYPLYVNSWYRPKSVNDRVSKSVYSRHQYGDAVDIKSLYFSPYEIYRILERHHIGGLSAYNSFVHIDWRGIRARW